jgi:succinylarginine dihydrolase
VNYAVVGVEQVELNALQGNGFVGVDEECHVTAAGDAFLIRAISSVSSCWVLPLYFLSSVS